MRRGIRVTLSALVAGPAVAAMVMAGGGTAHAAAAAPARPATAATGPMAGPAPGPGMGQAPWWWWNPGRPHYGCDQWALERWNLNGPNTVDLLYQSQPFSYSVSLHQAGECLYGTLYDTHGQAPLSLKVRGMIDGNFVYFSVRYPQGSAQGTRYFFGIIKNGVIQQGTWGETGSEQGGGRWWLQRPAAYACASAYWWWHAPRACHVW